jgi:integral membrane sensor domain MASE1
VGPGGRVGPLERNWTYAARIAVIAAAYYGAAKLGLSLAFTTENVTAIWPPTGIALAAVVLWGYRVWPGIALGAFLANAWTDIPLYTTLGITTGNTLEALVGAYLLRRVDFSASLERVRDVFALVLLAGFVSTAVAATIGVTSLMVGDEVASGDFGVVWRTWWLGDMGGDLVVAPALLIAATHWPFDQAPGRWFEACACAVIAAGASVLVFTREVSITFLLYPPVLWGALRFWQSGAAAATLIIAAIGIPLTEDDLGPFMGHSPDDRLLLAQALVGVLSVTGLVLAAVLTERQRSEDTVEQIADTLQESLLPELPDVPGIEAAVDFHAAGERHMVGGDFYDLFQAEDGSWGVVVGDVLGKGAEAAATTSLARYTIRAEAARERRPSRILERLNDAILRQNPDQSCSVAYSRMELEPGAGARLTVSIGGHPLPLILRADGTVDTLGKPGPLLGVRPQPMLSDFEAELGAGDALFLYTDGLTEAHAPDRIYSPEELGSALSAQAGKSAGSITAGIHQRLLGPGPEELRDDVVLFVLRVPGAAREGLPPTTPASFGA